MATDAGCVDTIDTGAAPGDLDFTRYKFARGNKSC
jgi:hypothetical protein